jgi:hypothetical protein
MRVFNPWKGDRYDSGFKVLIVGESQADAINGPPHPNETIAYVQTHAIACTPSLMFFKKLTKLLLGLDREPKLDERKALWHRAAFCNYLQHRMSAARQKTTSEMWSEASAPFNQTVQELEPDFILVCGRRVGEAVSLLRNGIASAQMNHPCSPGWSYNKWAPVVRHALTEAGAPKWPLDLHDLRQTFPVD